VQAFEGDYKWILYGDDDTFFFVDGVLELLQDFDPSLPYFITGIPYLSCPPELLQHHAHVTDLPAQNETRGLLCWHIRAMLAMMCGPH